MNKTTVIYNDEYYQLHAIYNSDKFKNIYNKFLEQLSLYGIEQPIKFSSIKSYNNWKKIVLEKAEGKVFIRDWIHTTLLEFYKNKPKIRKDLILAFEDLVFLDFEQNIGKYSKGKIYAQDGDFGTIISEITVNTKLEEYTQSMSSYWEDVIQPWQKKEQGGVKRNRGWSTFDRDLKIYLQYLQLKKENHKSLFLAFKKKPLAISIDPDGDIFIEDNYWQAISKCKRYFQDLKLT